MTDPRAAGNFRSRLVGEIDEDFFVPDYQRGYRWGVDEVRRLLADIEESGDRDYYLQPVVVKQRQSEWELIDGQQRLTTLFLVLQYLKNSGLKATGAAYSMRYQTREESAEFLRDPTQGEVKSSIDFFHIHQAYAEIGRWFDGKGPRKEYAAGKFYTALFERVHVFWYVAPDDVEATDLFIRLNVGKIPLTDAELVKAQLLATSRGNGKDSDRARAVAAEWDAVERGLRVPEVWSFVTALPTEAPTHIDLLLDAVADRQIEARGDEVPKGQNRPPFLTFETLRTRLESPESAREVWAEVVDLYNLVQGWYEDLPRFHKIGYLVACGDNFADLVKASHGLTGSGFDEQLDDRIRTRLNLSADDLAELSYESARGRAKVTDVLLLMNVETVATAKSSSERYSFRQHAAGGWSLEHIHAQSAERLNTSEQRISWLEYHRDALSSIPGLDPVQRDAVVEEIEAALKDISAEKFQALETKLAPYFDAGEETVEDETHAISNLALLGRKDNSALNNSAFEVKRRVILQRVVEGSYVPVCTRNVFLKFYNQRDNLQMHFWSRSDRESYLREIIRVLNEYLLPVDELTETPDDETGSAEATA